MIGRWKIADIQDDIFLDTNVMYLARTVNLIDESLCVEQSIDNNFCSFIIHVTVYLEVET